MHKPCLSGRTKPRLAPSRHCRHARACGRTTTAMHDNQRPPPSLPHCTSEACPTPHYRGTINLTVGACSAAPLRHDSIPSIIPKSASVAAKTRFHRDAQPSHPKMLVGGVNEDSKPFLVCTLHPSAKAPTAYIRPKVMVGEVNENYGPARQPDRNWPIRLPPPNTL